MRKQMRKQMKKPILSLLFAFAFLFSGLNINAFANTEYNSAAVNISAGYAYEDQVYFDPLDSTPLIKAEYAKPGALADESQYYVGRDAEECRAEYEEIAEAIIAKINTSWSDFRKVAFLHDYICETTNYDYTGCGNMISYSAYGCLVLHTSVCDGYSRAFYDLANRAGIETYYVCSYQMDHAWNVSKIDGKFYYIDCTWDGEEDITSHSCFLKSENRMTLLSHNNEDLIIPTHVTVGSNPDFDIRHKYNNTEYDNAPFNDYNGALIFEGDTDQYYVFENDSNLVLMNGNTVLKRITITYEYTTGGSINQVYKRDNKFIVVKNKDVIYYGTLENNTLDLKVLKDARYREDGSYTYCSFKEFGLKGTTLNVNAYMYDWDAATGYYETYTIDVSDFLAGTTDPFALTLGGRKRGDSNESTNGSQTVIEGLHLQWNTVNGKSYWYENGIKQGTYDDAQGVMGDGTIRGREIFDPATNGWYWLDSCYDGAKAVNKEVWMPYIYNGEAGYSEDTIMSLASACDGGMEGLGQVAYKAMIEHTGKWVRYDSEGKMFKGWLTISGDLATLYPTQAGNTYYYDNITGLMARGWVTIGGVSYYFDEITGALQ